MPVRRRQIKLPVRNPKVFLSLPYLRKIKLERIWMEYIQAQELAIMVD